MGQHVIFEKSKKLESMKATFTKNNHPGIFANPISRNLTLIFLGGFLAALTIVTAGVILFNLIVRS